MDMIIVVLAILGFSSIIIAAYVLAAATRLRNTNDSAELTANGAAPKDRRRNQERRRAEPAQFPITINGNVITEDRRRFPDRRVKSAA